MKMCRPAARFLLLVSFVTQAVLVQGQANLSGTAEIEESLRKLNELGSVLMIAAHPDDERTGVLAYFARGRHMRTAYLSATRGEGGQNLIGAEQGAQLGLIRTQELLAARRIDGAQQFFTRAIDFGFTRTPEEALQMWGHDRILSDMVWVIRRYRPDVVILCFTGTPRDGHGQHQASAILGREAFQAAADPARFPEQLQYAQPWQARRLAQASFNFGAGPGPGSGGPPGGAGAGGRGGRGGRGGARNADPPREPAKPIGSPLETDTGAYNPILGYSYEQIAGMSRSMHRSQGMGNLGRVGEVDSEFTIIGGDAASKDLFDGIDTSWNRLSGGAAIGAILADASRAFDPARPENIIPSLTKARPLIAALSDPLARIKLEELDDLLAQCAGLWIDAQAREPETVPGSYLSVTTTVINRSRANVKLDAARLEGVFNEDLPVEPVQLGYNQTNALTSTRRIPPAEPYSQPYWLEQPPTGSAYTVPDQRLIGLADTPPILRVSLRLSVDGAPFEVTRPVEYRYADRVEGARIRPIAVVPPVALEVPNAVAMFPAAAERKVAVTIKGNTGDAKGEVRLDVPAGWKVIPKSMPFHVGALGELEQVFFDVTPPAADSAAPVRAVATTDGREITSGMQVISYSHIPTQILLPPSTGRFVRADIKVTAHKIGYIMGAGDDMPDALRELGLEVTLLSSTDLEQGDLSRFDAIVAGVRAYNVRADVRASQRRLLDYVSNGGTYIVQYNTGDNSLNVGPYPITEPPGNRYRVTVEDAPVTLPHPDSRLLQYPNHINPKDFEGWVQERGVYFASKWDPKYETVMASKDPDEEEPLAGGQLWTHYGKGVYIFTAYSWFRQLPAGVPGAYRMFANLLSAK
ncbi:MAG TPA: PIG-L family deacetylase [Bryobacteraceae bacterium]|jgi:LmbE family N-acetylglucosaminyl deacetylase